PGCVCSRCPHLCLDAHREREIERRSLAWLRFNPNPAAVHLDDALGDRQAEAGPALLAGNRAVGLLELLEDLGLIVRGNPGPGVANRNRERPVCCLCSDRHLALVGEFYRVAAELKQPRREPLPTAVARRQARRALGLEGQSLLSGKRLDRRYAPVDHVAQRVVVKRQRELARLYL